MEVKYKVSGRGELLHRFIKKMENDEHLLRLLYYNPLDKDGNYVDFTDSNLPNILDFEEEKLDQIRNDLIRKSEKNDDIAEEKKSIIFVYYGKSRPVFNNHTQVKREVIMTILSHNDFAFDYRIEEICDRLDSLFVGEKRIGLGEVTSGISFKREAPKEYLAFEQKYIITDKRK